MKIAMIGHKRIPSREGGIEVVVNELSVRMAEKGHSVDVYNRNSGEEKLTSYKNVKIYEVKTLKKSGFNALVYSFFATIRALTKGYDVIHYHAEGPCAMIPIAHFFKIHTVATIHGLDWDRSKWGGFASKYIMFGEKMAVKYADEIIVLSSNMQKYFLDRYGRKTTIIPNGINKTNKLKADIITEKYGLQEKSYILFVARITPEKGLHYLIDAFKQLNTDKKLVIAGRDDPETEYIKSIKEKVASDDRIIMTGFVQGDELFELFSNCFLYVLPSDIEGMPLSLLEAIGYRARCLISDIPENTEPAGDYAYSFKKSDTNDLKNKLEYILDNEQLYDSNFNASLTKEQVNDEIDSIKKRYSWDEVVNETIKLYEKSR